MTISTVGYGDVLPTTDFTQGVVCLLMLVGLTFIMYNVAILSEVRLDQVEYYIAGLRRAAGRNEASTKKYALVEPLDPVH